MESGLRLATTERRLRLAGVEGVHRESRPRSSAWYWRVGVRAGARERRQPHQVRQAGPRPPSSMLCTLGARWQWRRGLPTVLSEGPVPIAASHHHKHIHMQRHAHQHRPRLGRLRAFILLWPLSDHAHSQLLHERPVKYMNFPMQCRHAKYTHLPEISLKGHPLHSQTHFPATARGRKTRGAHNTHSPGRRHRRDAHATLPDVTQAR